MATLLCVHTSLLYSMMNPNFDLYATLSLVSFAAAYIFVFDVRIPLYMSECDEVNRNWISYSSAL